MERKYRRGEDRVTRGKRDEATGSQGAEEEEIEEKLFSQSSCFGALRWPGSKSKKKKTPRSTENLREAASKEVSKTFAQPDPV